MWIADIHPSSAFAPESISAEALVRNLCDIAFCEKVVCGAHIIFHFAAAMGGMGTIHPTNDFIIYSENHTMTQNLLASSVSTRVTRFFYASSACVYPEHLQDSNALAADVSLPRLMFLQSYPPSLKDSMGLRNLIPSSSFTSMNLPSKFTLLISTISMGQEVLGRMVERRCQQH